MITDELYINYERADLSDSNPIAVTYQINDLADLKDRQSTYSQTVKLPKTLLNKRLLGYADSDSFTQAQPYSFVPAKLVQSGVETISYGQIVLQTVSDYFECQLLYGLVGINDILSITSLDVNGNLNTRDANLTDLDYSDIQNFTFDLPTVVASQSGTGVLFPVIDYGGTLDNSSIIDITYLRPGIYFNDLINRIQTYTGYTFKGAILSNTTYLNDFIPFSATTLYDYEGTDWGKTNLPISVKNNIPSIAIKDFLKDFMQRYFLTPVVDNYAKTIEFRSFDELYSNVSTAKDWTDKFIDDARTDEFQLNGYSQTNYLNWTQDEVLLTNGNGALNVNNSNITSLSTTLLTSIFAASNYVIALGNQYIASIKKLPTPPVSSTGAQFSVDTQTRIVNIRDAKPGTYGYKRLDAEQFSNNCKVGLFWSPVISNGIGYDNQLSNFGTGLQKLLKKARIVTRYAIIKPSDLYNFDYFTPVYDGKEAKYYYVNGISNFVNGVKTKINLIRM